MVAELAKCQAALPRSGFNTGYLSAFPESSSTASRRARPSGRPTTRCTRFSPACSTCYQLSGNAQALDRRSRNMARLGEVPQRPAHPRAAAGDARHRVRRHERSAGQPLRRHRQRRHLRTRAAFDHDAVFDPLAAGRDRAQRLHANTQIPKLIGAGARIRADRRPRATATSPASSGTRVAAAPLVRRSAATATASTSSRSTDFASTLGTDTLGDLQHLQHAQAHAAPVRVGAAGGSMDFYERALYNHILASQDPERRHVRTTAR